MRKFVGAGLIAGLLITALIGGPAVADTPGKMSAAMGDLYLTCNPDGSYEQRVDITNGDMYGSGTATINNGGQVTVVTLPPLNLSDLKVSSWFNPVYGMSPATITVTDSFGRVMASKEVACSSTAKPMTVKAKAVSSKSKLKVDVNPNKGKGYYKFQVQRLNADGTWKPLKTYKTNTSKETRTVNLKKGTYRVEVFSKYNLAGVTSGAVILKR